jgi:hypothetical protein
MKFIIEKAYYIKLGESGKWEESSIFEGKVRIGWGQQSIDDINSKRWDKIKRELEKTSKHKATATTDYRTLRFFTESTPDDIWITFFRSHLWWCRLSSDKVREDKISKYRVVDGKWSKCDLEGNPLLIESIPGSISKIRGFRGTICRVREIDDLRRLINHEFSAEYSAIAHSKEHLVADVERGIKRLHWKNFELLIDLIFHKSGWQRVSFVGTAKEFSDIDLKDPITGDLYQVQIKSQATEKDFLKYATSFSAGKYRKLFFVVHTPDEKLVKVSVDDNPDVELILSRRVAEMVVELGLVDWLMSKIQ